MNECFIFFIFAHWCTNWRTSQLGAKKQFHRTFKKCIVNRPVWNIGNNVFYRRGECIGRIICICKLVYEFTQQTIAKARTLSFFPISHRLPYYKNVAEYGFFLWNSIPDFEQILFITNSWLIPPAALSLHCYAVVLLSLPLYTETSYTSFLSKDNSIARQMNVIINFVTIKNRVQQQKRTRTPCTLWCVHFPLWNNIFPEGVNGWLILFVFEH